MKGLNEATNLQLPDSFSVQKSRQQRSNFSAAISTRQKYSPSGGLDMRKLSVCTDGFLQGWPITFLKGSYCRMKWNRILYVALRMS